MEQDTIDHWKKRRPDAEHDSELVYLWLVHIETGRYLDEEGAVLRGGEALRVRAG